MPLNKESCETSPKTTMLAIFHETASESFPTHEEFVAKFAHRSTQALLDDRVTQKDFEKFNVQDTLRLEELAAKDFLTGLWARAGFEERLREELERSNSVAVLMVDFDEFRKVNNRFGHQEGDNVLIACGEILNEITKKAGFAGRWGGDELVVALPNAEKEEAEKASEEINQRLSSIPKEKAKSEITASIGIYISGLGDVMKVIINRADQAALAAKAAGGNQVCVWKPEYQPKN